MSMLSSVSKTGSTVLGSINTAATSISHTLTTVASTLDMADAFIQKAKEKQYTDNKFEMAHYADHAQANALANAARVKKDLIKELNADPELKAVYNELAPEFNKIREELDAELLEMRNARKNVI